MKTLYLIFLIIFLANLYLTKMLFAQNHMGNWILTSDGYRLVSDLNIKPEIKNNSLSQLSDLLIFDIQNVLESRLYTFDINQDGLMEFVIPCIHTNNQCKIHVYNSNGIPVVGFPFQLPRALIYPPSISLYDNNKIILAYYQNDKAYFLGINSAGELTIPEFEIAGVSAMLTREPAVTDITGDGEDDIIFLYSHAAFNTSTIVLYNPITNQIIQKFVLNYAQAGPALGDINGDGINDVIQETGMFWDNNVIIWAFKGDGTILPNWPIAVSGSTLFTGVHLADFVGDNRPEIILQLSDYVVPPVEYLKVLSPDGQEIMNRTFNPVYWGDIPFTAICKTFDSPSPANPPILILGRENRIYYNDLINNTTESIFLGKSPGDLKLFRSVANNSPGSELITIAVQTGSGFSTVYVIDQNRQIVQQIDFNSIIEVKVTDLENDGYLDIISTSKNSSGTYSINVISDFYQYDPNKIEWPLYKHDISMSSNYNYQEAIVPVEIQSFIINVYENAIVLNWATATETNNSGFEVERLQDSNIEKLKDWESIGFVPGFGTTTEPKAYSFIDEDITTGTYKYRLKQIDFDGSFEYSNEIEVAVDFTPKEFVLYQNYPNPFNPKTVISYQLPVTSNVTLKVYDVLGNEVTTLVNEEKQPGVYEVEFDASSLASGMYLYKLQAGDFVQTRKMILTK